jgi:hypothetical protein
MPTLNTNVNTSAPSPGRQDYSAGLGAPKKEYTITERVTLTHGQPFVYLSSIIPPRCRVVWLNVVNQTAININGTASAGSAASGGFIICATTATIPTTGTVSNATASALFNLQTVLSTTGILRQTTPVNTSFAFNTSTNSSAIIVLPAGTSTSGFIQANTGGGTNGFLFGTGTGTASGTNNGIIDVAIYVEQYDDVVGINY